jgi:hypothetical protein
MDTENKKDAVEALDVMAGSAFREIGRRDRICRYPVWLVETTPTSTTNPMTKRRALLFLKERRAAGKHAELIKTWACVQGKNLEPNASGEPRPPINH